MFRKALITLSAAALAAIMASSAHAALNLQLSIVAQPTAGPIDGGLLTGGTWQVYATLTGDTSTTSGLAGLQIDVTASGGLTVLDYDQGDDGIGTTLDLPNGNAGNVAAGFNLNDSTGTDGQAIAGFQNTTAYKKGTGANASYVSVLSGVGLASGSEGSVSASVSWAYPVLVADGYYTGTKGTLTVDSAANFDVALPAALPTPTTAGAGITAIDIDTVNGVAAPGEGTASAPVGTPEPASLGMLALGGLALLARRRKTA